MTISKHFYMINRNIVGHLDCCSLESWAQRRWTKSPSITQTNEGKQAKLTGSINSRSTVSLKYNDYKDKLKRQKMSIWKDETSLYITS